MKEFLKTNWFKIFLPISIIIGTIIIGGFFYAIQVNKQKSIEKQQRIDLEAKAKVDLVKTEQEKKEYIAKRKLDCYDIEQRERKNWNNVDGSFYVEDEDVCRVRYKTSEYKGVDCEKKYGKTSPIFLDCIIGMFTKDF